MKQDFAVGMIAPTHYTPVVSVAAFRIALTMWAATNMHTVTAPVKASIEDRQKLLYVTPVSTTCMNTRLKRAGATRKVDFGFWILDFGYK